MKCLSGGTIFPNVKHELVVTGLLFTMEYKVAVRRGIGAYCGSWSNCSDRRSVAKLEVRYAFLGYFWPVLWLSFQTTSKT
jgi:hypothetical protein